MGAVRLTFIKGREDWDYGYITLRIWLASSLILTNAPKHLSLFNYEHNAEPQDLIKQLDQGEVTLNYYQTLCFIKINDLLCKILLTGKEDNRLTIFALVCRFTQSFENLAAFETYYLRYSTDVITLIKEEFNKEPGLRDKLSQFLDN